MKKSKNRMIFCITLLVLNIAFIWGNSLLPREVSAAFSTFVGRIISIFFPGDITPDAGVGHGILRKVAHFLEFCSLGVMLSWLVRMLRDKAWECILVPLIAGVAVAALDETIQLFIPGRGPQIRDVGIDSLGVLLGIALVWLISKLKKRNDGK